MGGAPCADWSHTTLPRYCNKGRALAPATHRRQQVWVSCTSVHLEWQRLQ